jgi:hypothetical protein
VQGLEISHRGQDRHQLEHSSICVSPGQPTAIEGDGCTNFLTLDRPERRLKIEESEDSRCKNRKHTREIGSTQCYHRIMFI